MKRKQIWKINENESCFLFKDKTDEPLARLRKRERKVRNEKGITTDNTEVLRINKKIIGMVVLW